MLRLLSVRDNDPGMWSRLDLLMDHVEDNKQNTDHWETIQINIVDWLLDPQKGGLQGRFTAEEINRAMGLIQTNAINMEKVGRNQMISCKALYPTFSYISHSCVANARVTFRSDNSIRVIAQVNTISLTSRFEYLYSERYQQGRGDLYSIHLSSLQ